MLRLLVHPGTRIEIPAVARIEVLAIEPLGCARVMLRLVTAPGEREVEVVAPRGFALFLPEHRLTLRITRIQPRGGHGRQPCCRLGIDAPPDLKIRRSDVHALAPTPAFAGERIPHGN
jgi:hypothetical protein